MLFCFKKKKKEDKRLFWKAVCILCLSWEINTYLYCVVLTLLLTTFAHANIYIKQYSAS